MKITMSTFCSGIVEGKKGIEQRHLHDPCIHTQIQEGTLQVFVLISSAVICVYSCIFKFYIRAFKKSSKLCASNEKEALASLHLIMRSHEPMERPYY